MPTKKKTSIVRTIKNFILMVPALFGFMKTLTLLLRYETRLARKSLAVVLLCLILFAALLASMWLCVLAILFVYLTTVVHLSALLTLGLILLLNVLLLVIVVLIMVKAKENLFFPETSRQIARLSGLSDLQP